MVTNNKMIQTKINELNDKYDKTRTVRENVISDIHKLSDILNVYRNAKTIIKERDDEYNKFNTITENLKKWKEVIKIWNKTTYIYNSNKNYLENTLYVKKNEYENELMNLNKKRDEMTTFFISKRQIESLRNEIQTKFNRVNILNKIWSPKVGYPSWKIEDFLNKLTIKTNEDMNSMWGSDLKIKEFKLDASDFSIIMEKDNVEIKDASLCSQGERETINAAISFSIIESNIENNGYDVLRLDEVDGPLDEKRRIGFIDMIQKRVDEMNCDSCFIITHNGEFEDIPCDIILLNGAKVPDAKLKNKNILYRYQGV
jgi:DNA repair exonuclease SbcCD ATPase subunit